jgi:hypothetical protein
LIEAAEAEIAEAPLSMEARILDRPRRPHFIINQPDGSI